MESWFWPALGAVALLILKIWIEHEIKDRGWSGLAHKLGTVGLVTLLVYAGLATLGIAYSASIYSYYGFPPIDRTGIFRPAVFVSILAYHWGLPLVLAYFARNIMAFLSAIALWANGALGVYLFFYERPNIPNLDPMKWLALQLDDTGLYSSLIIFILAIITGITAGITTLHNTVASWR